ncbi:MULTISPECIES: DoxX family protein [Glycomyces]|uniref:DoxX family protein n=2 Tax=Glycomyces TaxID=58113 RepID=A0A9X3T7A3_9ACTN|nr:DoxX family protein [Glycomyces lechevalierae]MDA1383998.1 DoxX family protein [Glycomyces lechevalierae]MDR7341008.1 putative membrane protein [Glycomyces lechevalierae]
MEPLIAFAATTLVLRLLGRVKIDRFNAWRPALRGGLTALFLTTGVVHFVPEYRDSMIAMIPPGLPWPAALVAVTGVLELAGAVGLWVRPFKRAAAVCLTLLMLAMFPANVYASLNGIEFAGAPADPLGQRILIEVLWIGAAIAVATEPASTGRRARLDPIEAAAR